MNNFLREFKYFALKGNVMDLAVGVIIGGAFSSIVDSLVTDIINPIIGILFQTDFSSVVLNLPFDISLNIGNFISNVINFLLMAFVLFCIVKSVNKAEKLVSKPQNEEETAPVKSDETILLEQILETLKEK